MSVILAEGIPDITIGNLTAITINSTAIEVGFTIDLKSHIVDPRFSTLGYRIHARKTEDSRLKTRRTSRDVLETRIPRGRRDDSERVVSGSLVNRTRVVEVVGKLKKFSPYEIYVVCFTQDGDGAQSESILIQTSQDGKIVC